MFQPFTFLPGAVFSLAASASEAHPTGAFRAEALDFQALRRRMAARETPRAGGSKAGMHDANGQRREA